MAMQLDQLNGLACELKQMDNAPVSIGQVVAAEGEALRIQAPFDFPPDLAAGTKLKLTATAPDGSFSVLAGNVVEVGGSLLTLHGINNVKEYGQRRFFRVDVNIPGEIRQEGLFARPDPIPVVVRNLSVGGVLFRSEKIFLPETAIRLDPSFFSGDGEELHAVILRGQRLDGGMAYGAGFAEMPDWLEDQLSNFIFSMQRGRAH